MKILIPIVAFERAGGMRVLSELASAWVDAGQDVDFLVDHRSAPPYFPTRANIRRFNARGRVDLPAHAGGFAASGNGLSVYGGMTRALGRIGRDYDVILANHSLSTIPVTLARTGAARPFYYVQAHEPEYYALEKGLRARVLEALSTLSYRLPLTQIANAPVYVGYADIRARDWIPPGIDGNVFRRRNHGPEAGPGRPWVIGTIGRREPAKGTIHALRAFEKLAQVDPDVRLRVAYGNLPEGWHHERAEIVVPRNDAELADYYRSIDVLLATATVQLGACHYPVIEAMACGTPVVTTGYLPADADNAWIVPVGDSDAIVEAIHRIRAESAPALAARMDRAVRATERFLWPRVAADMLRLFEASPAH
jgi:glycosyltransferase involved in cell wall biosynthesis